MLGMYCNLRGGRQAPGGVAEAPAMLPQRAAWLAPRMPTPASAMERMANPVPATPVQRGRLLVASAWWLVSPSSTKLREAGKGDGVPFPWAVAIQFLQDLKQNLFTCNRLAQAEVARPMGGKQLT